MRYIFKTTIVMLILCLGGATLPTLAQDAPQVPQQLIISDSNAERFPEVEVILRANQANGLAASEISPQDFTISETHTNLQVNPLDAPLNIYFLIDLSDNTNPEKARFQDVIRNFEAEVFRPDDQVQFITMQGNDQINTADADTPSSFLAGFELLQFGGYASSNTYVEAIEQAARNLAPAYQAGQNALIIVMGSYFTSNTPLNSNAQGIPIASIQVHGERPQYTSNFAGIATEGLFVELQLGADINLLDPLWQTLNQNRRFYQLTYRSQDGTSGTRTVTVGANVAGNTISNDFNYAQTLSPPNVEITGTQSNFAITRTAQLSDVPTEDGQQGYRFDQYNETITARVSFPDNVNRQLLSAQLEVNGQGIPETRITPLNQTDLEFSWDITSYREDTTATIAVQVADEFNLVGRSPDRNITIGVNIPEQVAEITVVEVVEEIIQDPCIDPTTGNRLTTAECRVAEEAETAITVMILLALAVVVLILLVILQRRRITSFASSAASVVTEPVINLSKTALAITGFNRTEVDGANDNAAPLYDNSNPAPNNIVDQIGAVKSPPLEARPATQTQGGLYGQIEVRQPNGYSDQVDITKREFVIGRELGAGVDYEIRSKHVSAIHCTIRVNRETNQITIEDNKSSNGTYINNERLIANRPYILNQITEIRLAQEHPTFMVFRPFQRPSTYQADSYIPPGSSSVTAVENSNFMGGKTMKMDDNDDLFDDDLSNSSTVRGQKVKTPSSPTQHQVTHYQDEKPFGTDFSNSRSEVFSGLILKNQEQETNPYTPYSDDEHDPPQSPPQEKDRFPDEPFYDQETRLYDHDDDIDKPDRDF